MRNLLTRGLLAGVILFSAQIARAQDTHYWDLNYGTRGELVSGVVVGTALDLSSTFYNPGAFVKVKDPSVLLTGSVFAFQSITVTTETQDQRSPSSSNTGPAPSMVAGVLPMKWFGGRMGYSFLTRQQLDFRLTARDGVLIGLDQPGDSISTGGEVILEQNMSETWGGLSWSKELDDRVSVGATVYGAYRSQRTRVQSIVEGFGNNGYGASVINVEEIDFWTAAALAKVGVLADFGDISIGMAVTSPELPIMGSGSTVENSAITGDINFDGISDSGARVAYGDNRDATYHTPWSVAAGASYTWTSTTFLATAEFFNSVDEYRVIDSSPTAGGPGVTGTVVRYDGAAKSVWNLGIAVEHNFSEHGTAYGAFITDRSSYQKVTERNIVLSDWDILHVSGGVAFAIGRTELTLGGAYEWGSAPMQRSGAYTGDLPPAVSPSEVKFHRLKAIIGFSI